MAIDSQVTIYFDIMTICMATGIMFMSAKNRYSRDEHMDFMHKVMCITLMINALSNGISYALHHRMLDWPHPVRVFFPSVAEYSTLVIGLIWIVYIDYMVNESWDHIRQVYRVFVVPVVFMGVLTIINFFNGFMFTMDENMMFTAGSMFTIMTVAQYVYGFTPILVVLHHIRLHGPLKFFSIWPMMVPVAMSALFTFFTNCSMRSLGMAVALAFLHFSYAEQWRYIDPESGFYNREYTDYLKIMIRKGKFDYQGGLCIETEGDQGTFFKALRGNLPDDCEVIRIRKNGFLIFTENANINMLTFLSQMIEESLEDYSDGHPDENVAQIFAVPHQRKKDETGEEFIDALIEQALS